MSHNRSLAARLFLTFIFCLLYTACTEVEPWYVWKIHPESGIYNEHFGFSIDMDGPYLLVGASGDGENNNGSAYIYRREFDEIYGDWISASGERAAEIFTSGGRVIVAC